MQKVKGTINGLEMYRGFIIEKSWYADYWEAYDNYDCDRPMVFCKTKDQLKIEIDEIREEGRDFGYPNDYWQ